MGGEMAGFASAEQSRRTFANLGKVEQSGQMGIQSSGTGTNRHC
jgi:hypothetical protein